MNPSMSTKPKGRRGVFIGGLKNKFKSKRRGGGGGAGVGVALSHSHSHSGDEDGGYGATANHREGREGDLGSASRRQPSRSPFQKSLADSFRGSARDRDRTSNPIRDEDSAVVTIEWITRQAIAVLASYCCGVWFPTLYPIVKSCCEYLTVAWVTCIMILLLSYWKQHKHRHQHQHQHQHQQLWEREDDEESAPLLQEQQQEQPRSIHLLTSGDAVASYEDIESQKSKRQQCLVERKFLQPHPAFDPFYVMDARTGDRIIPNTSTPYSVDNDLFSGHMLFMVRTPNVDDPDSAAVGTVENLPYENFFRTKQRRWELQFQIKIKRVPSKGEKLYFGTELENVVHMGFVQRALVAAAMAFVKKRSNNFHYSLAGDEAGGPYMAFGLEEGMLRIISTKPGDTPPPLGSSLDEDAASVAQRFKTGKVDWNTEDTFTLSFWTAYFDFLLWKTVNLPGIRPFSLCSVVGPQHINILFYMTRMSVSQDGSQGDGAFDRCTAKEYVNLEFSNSDEMTVGPVARKWIASRHNRIRERQHGKTTTEPLPPLMPHPALNKFYVIDTLTGRRATPNSLEPFAVECDYFVGKGMLLVRTPDVDDPTGASKGTTENDFSCDYLKDKQRRWELQFQFKLKKKLDGKLFFGCDLEEPVNMGMLQLTFVTAAMAFVKKRSNNFHYNLGSSSDETSTPFMAFGLEEGMMRIVATKEGEEPPTLGSDLKEDPESIKQRFKNGNVNWNTEDTFTVSFWTAYFDFLDWKTVNLPGMRPFSLRSVVGPQHINIRFYMVPHASSEEQRGIHDRSNAIEFVNLEFSNEEEMQPGPGAQQWIAHHKTQSGAPIMGGNESIIGDVDPQEETVAELGEGLYLRSGEPVLVNVLGVEGEEGFVSRGGDFAVVQRDAPSTLIFEKAVRQRGTREGLIRSGDVVMIKLITDNFDVKFLSIHRGWWLKWVTLEPKHNGFFTIHSVNDEDVDQGSDHRHEQQSSFIGIGDSFSLLHQKFKGRVGLRPQESASYGGRLLGLYDSIEIPPADLDAKEDDEYEYDGEGDGDRKAWMKQIVFTTTDLTTMKATTPTGALEDSTFSFDAIDAKPSKDGLYLTTTNCSLDTPVWIEMMHRSQRRRQLAYVVRVIVENDTKRQELGDKAPNIPHKTFCTLRSGKTLAQVIRAGLGEKKQKPAFRNGPDYNSSEGANLDYADAAISDECKSIDALSDIEDDFEEGIKKRRGLKFMDRFAETVKTGTAKTGKGITKHSKIVGKGTVNAGRAIMSPMKFDHVRAKRPPLKEPKTIKVNTPDPFGDLKKKGDMDALGRTLKKMKKRTSTMNWLAERNVLAGQLSPPEQSLRTTSHALERMSNASPSSPLANDFEVIANEQFLLPSDLDSSFLKGGAAQVFVIPPDRDNLLHGSLVARCRWESHWREEWCGLYKTCIMLFAPLSKRPVIEISFGDTTAVRSLETNNFSPLPGFSILVIETNWQCTYLAFSSESGRDFFKSKLDEQIFFFQQERELKMPWKALFWQGCQDLLDTFNASGDHKWAKISLGGKPVRRIVLNGRRMAFDVQSLESPELDSKAEMVLVENFVSKLLDLALKTTFDSLEKDAESFVEFLNMASQLKTLPLDHMDLSDSSAYCIFVNLYHALLHLSLLLTVKGALNKKSNAIFMRINCFEIGGDIFSLAELYHCVVRGNMTKPISPKPPFLDVPRKSHRYTSCYGLSFTDPRTNFVLHTGALPWPRAVPILRPDTLSEQLQQVAHAFVERNLVVDHTKRLIFLPKVCEVYRNDFGSGDALSSFGFCLGLKKDGEDILRLTHQDPPYIIKFDSNVEEYHELLTKLDA